MQNYSAEERSYLWLDAFPPPTREKNALIEKAGSAVRLVKNCAEILEKTVKEKKLGVYNDMVESLKNDVFYKTLTEEYESRRIAAIPRISDGFFKEWKEAEDPPLVQYEKGNASLKKRDGFAVVGSRRTPPEAMKRTKETAERLSDVFTIVTGSADGGDEAARAGAEQNGGCIVALAGGFSSIENARCDFKNNLYVTEHAYSVPALKFSYERRNRLLAAIAKSALVVSAGEKSGALITARYVLSGGKPLFAFPYDPSSPAGRGCNNLIKNGAFLAENAEDIFRKLGVSPALRGDTSESGAARATAQKTDGMNETERAIFEALKTTGKANINALAHETGLPAWKISGAITSLEVKGILIRTGGNFVSLV